MIRFPYTDVHSEKRAHGPKNDARLPRPWLLFGVPFPATFYTAVSRIPERFFTSKHETNQSILNQVVFLWKIPFD